MKYGVTLALAPALLLSLAAGALACAIVPLFSPQDQVASALLPELDAAKTSIHCSLFGLSHPGLLGGLTDASKRGVAVVVGLDKKQAALASSLHRQLRRGGATVLIKKTGVLEHNKFCLIDGQTVLMGSWNWSHTAQAQDNSELILRDCPDTAAHFERAFRRIMERDRP
jgi:phosphatidylserine/phosphatidylglycerophosphate/cardiolipin synthase-like enzyme